MNEEGFELFERKEEKVKDAEKEKKESVKKDAEVDGKPVGNATVAAKQEKSGNTVETVKLVLLSLILIVCTVSMFFNVRNYYLYTSDGNQQLVFLDDVLGSNQQNDIVVEQPDVNAVTTTAAESQHITVVTQPNNSNTNSDSVVVQDGEINNNLNNRANQAQQTTTSAPAAQQDSDETNGPVNINTASVEQLMTLNGIGDVKAKAIVNYRNENGSFSSVDELLNVSGIGEKTLEKIRAYITVG